LQGFGVLHNGVGYEIKFQVEGSQGKNPNSHDSHLGQGGFDDRERKNGGHNQDRDRGTFKGRNSGNHGKTLDRTGDASQGDSQDDSMEDLIKDGSPEEDTDLLISSEQVDAGKDVDIESPQDCSIQGSLAEDGPPDVITTDSSRDLDTTQNTQAQDSLLGTNESGDDPLGSTKSLQGGMDTPEAELKTTTTPAGKIRVHNEQGSYFLDATKWPSLSVENSDEEPAQLTQEEDLMDISQVVFSSEEESSQGWVSPVKQKKIRLNQRKKVTVATRASSRIPRDGILIATKAMNRAKNRDNISSGMFPTNPFTVLNSIPNDELRKVLVDLDIDAENLDEQINLFKAEELVRADLAQANYKEYLDMVNRKSAPQDDVALQGLAMEVIDNTCRDITGDDFPECSKNSKPSLVKSRASGPKTRNRKQ